MSAPIMPPAPQTIRRVGVFVGLIVIVALIVPTFYEIRHEATETRRTIKLADLTLVVANDTSDEWSAGDVQSDCQIPGPGLLAFFATPADDRLTPAQPDGDESAREDTTFDPTWGNGSEPNWDMFEPQPVRKMPSAPTPARRLAPVNPVHVSRWWAAKPEPRPDRRSKRPLPIPAATRVVPLPSPGNPIATVD